MNARRLPKSRAARWTVSAAVPCYAAAPTGDRKSGGKAPRALPVSTGPRPGPRNTREFWPACGPSSARAPWPASGPRNTREQWERPGGEQKHSTDLSARRKLHNGSGFSCIRQRWLASLKHGELTPRGYRKRKHPAGGCQLQALVSQRRLWQEPPERTPSSCREARCGSSLQACS